MIVTALHLTADSKLQSNSAALCRASTSSIRDEVLQLYLTNSLVFDLLDWLHFLMGKGLSRLKTFLLSFTKSLLHTWFLLLAQKRRADTRKAARKTCKATVVVPMLRLVRPYPDAGHALYTWTIPEVHPALTNSRHFVVPLSICSYYITDFLAHPYQLLQFSLISSI